MKGLKFSKFFYNLYIKGNRFVGNFESVEEALAFARTYYPNVEYHVEPNIIYKFEAETVEGK